MKGVKRRWFSGGCMVQARWRFVVVWAINVGNKGDWGGVE